VLEKGCAEGSWETGGTASLHEIKRLRRGGSSNSKDGVNQADDSGGGMHLTCKGRAVSGKSDVVFFAGR